MVQYVAGVFLSIGLLLMGIAAVGVIKLPDFFTRLHASGVGETLGAFLITIGMMILTGFHFISIKILIIYIILMLTNPIGTHLIMLEAVHAWNYQHYNWKEKVGNNQKNEKKSESCAEKENEK